MKKLFLIIFIIFLADLLLADTLIGQIRSAEEDKALEGVSVYLEGMNKGTISDEKGNFVIKDLEPGHYFINFTRMGYKSFQKEIDFPQVYSLQIKLKRKPTMIEGMRVSSTVAVERETPVTFTNMKKKEIEEANFGQDIPMLMNELPNVFSYADAGSPMGYSYLKIRGFDQKRIGVMINGIPLNDPEDHQVYWVDMPDFAESISDIQFQRGVGSSIYGVSTFGGSLNMQTNHATKKEGSELFANFGSYNTVKYGFKTTHDIMNYFKLNLRLSRITSDGYRDNSKTEQHSYFAGLSKIGERSITELNFYGGNELTHAAWYASWEGDLQENHQHNPITYDNEIDDFSQPHYELHHKYMINENLNSENSLFYIKGKGYYEQYKEDRDLWEFGLAADPETIETDLIRQKWVEKNQYGWVGNLHWNHRFGNLTIGSYISLFDSEHWGEIEEVIGADTLSVSYEKNQEYHNYTGDKKYYTFYINEIFKPIEKISIMANLHYQMIDYKFRQHESGNFAGENLHSYEVDYNFFNPRFGVNYNLNESFNIYGNLSFAQREPTDGELFDLWDGPDDLGVAPLFANADTIYVNGQIDHIKWSDPYVKEEKLMDIELGFGYDAGSWKIKANLFQMNFQDEIIGYGTMDDDGDPIRGNADETVHRGVELEVKAEIFPDLSLSGSFSYNDNYFEKFIMKDWDANWNVIDVDYSGNKIGGFPDILASSKLSYEWKSLLTSLQIQHVGKQYLDNTENEDRIVEAYQLLNFGFSYKFDELLKKTDVAVNLKINNLLDKEYETSGYYDPWGGPDWSGANYYFPGAGRNIIAGIRVGF
ncbi:MAG: TonB-dependent receptor [Candidatus Cloacimonetes bacterium]|nr:TonB-dependent receptor [Candidatus Cloacimonadota bacterium]MCF7813465.1 TonB-dependent receptor [Candidatus Cloacimonadota bacterium]MCF7869167.1 TonB-dependent receptor [Candidatus Cloacimonadota bacterium]MCF7883399.1 TonB-dependent receptor [Candidatus Cloacimonadota bacterium]